MMHHQRSWRLAVLHYPGALRVFTRVTHHHCTSSQGGQPTTYFTSWYSNDLSCILHHHHSASSPVPTQLTPWACGALTHRRCMCAGTYGVLTLFGILPAAMAWVERERPRGSSSDSSRALSDGGGGASVQLVPGGRAALLALGGSAAAVILYEVVLTVGRQG